MSPSDRPAPHERLSAGAWRWAACAVVAIAVLARWPGLSTWSLWEDEEATIYYALNPHKAFPSFFPVFFLSLRAAFAVSGVSVDAARLFSAGVGLLSLWIAYYWIRRLFDRDVALVAVFLLAINPGHVFWSQSVRYYTALLGFEVLSLHWFFRGFEERRPVLLLLANVAFVLALLTHFSALLLIPVFVGYLGLTMVAPRVVPRYAPTSYVVFGAALLLEIAFFAGRVAALQQLLGGGGGLASARDPGHVLVTVLAYFGAPLMLVAFLGPFVARRRIGPAPALMLVTAAVPVLELLVIAALGVINVTWYYGFVALVATAALAADGIVALARRGARRWSAVMAAGPVVYSVAILAIYFTTAHGDRPRWREAAALMRSTGSIVTSGVNQTEVFATAPNVLAFYLGVPADATQGQTLVAVPDNATVPAVLARDRWYVIPAFELTDPLRWSLEERCTLEAALEARTGPRDRTLRVYRCRAA